MKGIAMPAGARALFERQIECIRRDDRAAQMQLYADDLLYEFPFATDRPRRLAGRDAFFRVMGPLWEQARQQGVKVVGCDARLHETRDPDLLVAEFTLAIEVAARRIELPFVQIIRARDGRIAAVREYFSPAARSEVMRP
jgi:hypothetical protein